MLLAQEPVPEIQAGALERSDKEGGKVFSKDSDMDTLVGNYKRILLINAIGRSVTETAKFATITQNESTNIKDGTPLSKLQPFLKSNRSDTEIVVASRTNLPGLDASHMRQTMKNMIEDHPDIGGIEISSGQIVYKQTIAKKEYILKKVRADAENEIPASPTPESYYPTEPPRA
jgi:hypothetical protein